MIPIVGNRNSWKYAPGNSASSRKHFHAFNCGGGAAAMAKTTRFLKRRMVASDGHPFVGRVFDLSIVELNFETYDEIASYPDCRYVFHCNMAISSLVRRVESLNMVGDLIWIDPSEWADGNQFVDRYSWLNVASDVLLMRLISVHDCTLSSS